MIFIKTLLKKHFDAELLFTDRDSLTYEIKWKDVYEKFFKDKHLFDFSNYLKDSKFFDQTNKKVIGKMKDESEGKIIGEFVGLKSKMHFMKDMVKNLIRQKESILELSLMNSKILYLTKKYSNIKWEEFKTKNIKWEHAKSTKYHHHVLMIKDLF